MRAYRVAAIAASGALSGLAGAALTLSAAGTFVEGITAGRGFVALAIVVFARWSPWGTLAGALLFGLAAALQLHFQASVLAVPYQFFLMLPYALTLLALLLPVGLARAPRALGVRFEAE